jgi:DNA polymerase elongation subunit (family B)
LKNFNSSQSELINKLTEATNNISKAVSPSDEFIYNIKQTNQQLNNLRDQIESLTESTRNIREKDIRFEIRREIENLLIDRVRDNDTKEKKD